MNRRRAASAILAAVAGAAVPRRLSAITARPASLEARLIEILNRRREEVPWEECDARHCVSCGDAQSVAFDCSVCGYFGTPKTIGCRCAEVREGRIEGFIWMKESFARGKMPAHLGLTMELLDQDLREAYAMPTTSCSHGTGDCCHTTPFCPVCGDTGDDNQVREGGHVAWELVRDLRSALSGGAA